MNRKVYCACDSNFNNYYKAQVGGGFSDINVFRGNPYQRGFGIGSLFARFGIPVLKFIGKHVLKTGVNIGNDVLNEKKFKEAVKSRVKVGFKEAATDSLGKLNEIIHQKGRGIKRKLYKKASQKVKRKKDIFS